MKSLSEKVHQVFTAVLTAVVIGAFTMAIETHTRLALLEQELQDTNDVALAIMTEISRIHPRQ